MKFDDLTDLIEDRTVKIMRNNSEYIVEHHAKELEESIENDGNPLIRTFQSYLHTAITLSTLNTIQILNDLGVLSLEKIEALNHED